MDKARERVSTFAENPVAMLLGGMAAGFLVGLLLPVSQYESERLRPIADDVKERVRDAGGEVMRRGSEVLKETIREQTREWQTQRAGLSGDTGHGLQHANMDLGPGQ